MLNLQLYRFYVDDINLIGIQKELNKIANYLKNKFKMNDFLFFSFFLKKEEAKF